MALEYLLSTARATDDFKVAVTRYAGGAAVERIRTVRHTPRVKVLRLIAQLLAREPHLVIESILVDAWSGCSDFRGTVTVATRDGDRVFRFLWDCSWRAVQQGWFDAFQLPDQIRAAREFGWQCFADWDEATAHAGGDHEPMAAVKRSRIG